jgi:dephospho-CoA kinase
MNIILVAPAGAGKDTVFSLLEPKGFRRYAFGDNIRLVCRTLRINGIQQAYHLLYQMLDWSVPPNLLRKLEEFRRIPKHDEKDRRLLQELGTYCREYDDNIWIRDIRKTAEYSKNMVITDCRRSTELKSFPDFVSIYIDSPYEQCLERLKERDGTVDELALQHKAEQEIESLREQCDFIVDNSSTIEHLQEQLEEILKYTQQ